MRLALYVCLKNICDGLEGQAESKGTHLDPPLFWLDNIFKVGSFCGKVKYIIDTILNAEAFFQKSDKVINYQTSTFFPQY
jgi:hypothetical protein